MKDVYVIKIAIDRERIRQHLKLLVGAIHELPLPIISGAIHTSDRQRPWRDRETQSITGFEAEYTSARSKSK